MSDTQTVTRQEDGYFRQIETMPDSPTVKKFIIWNERLSDEDLGKLVTEVSGKFRPFTIVIHDQRKP